MSVPAIILVTITVNLEIFARVGFYFREPSHMQSFVKIKALRNGEMSKSLFHLLMPANHAWSQIVNDVQS